MHINSADGSSSIFATIGYSFPVNERQSNEFNSWKVFPDTLNTWSVVIPRYTTSEMPSWLKSNMVNPVLAEASKTVIFAFSVNVPVPS